MTPARIGLAPYTISICGLAELVDHCGSAATHVVSILDPGAREPLALFDFPPHRRLDFRFHDVIDTMLGCLQPQPRDVEGLLAYGCNIPAGSHVLIHCHAGQSRSTAMAALLIAQARPDLPADRIFAAVSELRPRAWPNLRIVEIGDGLLGRGGALVPAVGPVYAKMIEREPILADLFIDGGRAREVSHAYGS